MSQRKEPAQANKETNFVRENPLRPNAGAKGYKEPHWRDVPWIFALLAFLIGLIVIASLDLRDYTKTQCFRNHYGDSRVVFFEPKILGILGTCILITLLLAGLYFCFAAVYTDHFIVFSMILQILVSLGIAIFYFCHRRWLSGFFGVVWLLFSSFLYWAMRHYIDTATMHLDVAMCLALRNPFMILLCAFGALFCSAWSVLIGSVTLAGFGKAITEDCSINRKLRPEGVFLLVIIILSISNYLITEVVKAVIRVTISSTYGCWCFDSCHRQSPSGILISEEFPKLFFITWEGFIGALSYSLGSICLSSVCLALSKLGTQVLAIWSQALMVNSVNIQASEEISIILIAWLISSGACYLEVALIHLTNYIFVYVAVDNASYIEGFRSTINLFKRKGCKAIINDCLAGGTLTFGSWCIGTVAALCAYVYMIAIKPYPPNGIYFVCTYIMIMCIQVCSILTTGISSGVQTIFVAMASDPERFELAHPEVYQLLNRGFY